MPRALNTSVTLQFQCDTSCGKRALEKYELLRARPAALAPGRPNHFSLPGDCTTRFLRATFAAPRRHRGKVRGNNSPSQTVIWTLRRVARDGCGSRKSPNASELSCYAAQRWDSTYCTRTCSCRITFIFFSTRLWICRASPGGLKGLPCATQIGFWDESENRSGKTNPLTMGFGARRNLRKFGDTSSAIR